MGALLIINPSRETYVQNFTQHIGLATDQKI